MAEKDKIKIVRLRSPESIKAVIGAGVSATSFPEQRVVVTRPSTTKAEIEHERGHIELGHKGKKPTNPITHIRQELAADYYAYRNTGQPKRILGHLRRLYNDLVFREYKVRPTRSIVVSIGRELKRLPDLPEGWAKDYAKLVVEYKRRNKRRNKRRKKRLARKR